VAVFWCGVQEGGRNRRRVVGCSSLDIQSLFQPRDPRPFCLPICRGAACLGGGQHHPLRLLQLPPPPFSLLSDVWRTLHPPQNTPTHMVLTLLPPSTHTLQPRASGTPMSSTPSPGAAAPQTQAMQAREAAPPPASQYQQLATPPPASGFAPGVLPPGPALATQPQGTAGNAYAAGGLRYPMHPPTGKDWATNIVEAGCIDGESCWWSLWCPLLLFQRTTARFDLVKSPLLFFCLMMGKKGRREEGKEGGREGDKRVLVRCVCATAKSGYDRLVSICLSPLFLPLFPPRRGLDRC
jgi:hypothetical protein